MKLNTNSNSYTIAYAAIVVVVVAFFLAFAESGLKERSSANERIDKKQQILAALNVRNIPKDSVEIRYSELVEADQIINKDGKILSEGKNKDKDGFNLDRGAYTPDQLPIWVCCVNGERKYVLPMVGKGLWGTIWGFISMNNDGKTVYGSYFGHTSETAGLGALINEVKFQNLFKNKIAIDNKDELVLRVVKAGTVKDETTQVDGITGSTLTTQGVNNMIQEYISLYQNYLKNAK